MKEANPRRRQAASVAIRAMETGVLRFDDTPFGLFVVAKTTFEAPLLDAINEPTQLGMHTVVVVADEEVVLALWSTVGTQALVAENN